MNPFDLTTVYGVRAVLSIFYYMYTMYNRKSVKHRIQASTIVVHAVSHVLNTGLHLSLRCASDSYPSSLALRLALFVADAAEARPHSSTPFPSEFPEGLLCITLPCPGIQSACGVDIRVPTGVIFLAGGGGGGDLFDPRCCDQKSAGCLS